jgi:hypothetical protein
MATLTFAKIRVVGFRLHRTAPLIQQKLKWFHRNDADWADRAPLSHNSCLFQRFGIRFCFPSRPLRCCLAILYEPLSHP